MKTKHIIRLALAMSLPVFSTFAQTNNTPQDGPGGRHHGHHPPPLPIVTALDTNHDGIISAEEIANASAALLTLDTNGDGQLTPNEYLPPHPGGGRGPGGTNDFGPPPSGTNNVSGRGRHEHPLPPIIAALDANHDGIISAEEIANAPAALKTLDKNGDGQLTPDEYLGPRPEGGRGPGGPDDGQGPPPGMDDGDGGPDDGQGPPPGDGPPPQN